MESRRPLGKLRLFAAATMTSAAFFASAASAQEDARVPALRAAEIARFDAQVSADPRALDQLLDAGLEYVHSNGEVDSKSSLIESLTSGRRDYVSADCDIHSIRIFGDVAIIRGAVKITVADQGQSRDLDLGYTDIWLWKDGRWQMTAWRSARLPSPAAK